MSTSDLHLRPIVRSLPRHHAGQPAAGVQAGHAPDPARTWLELGVATGTLLATTPSESEALRGIAALIAASVAARCLIFTGPSADRLDRVSLATTDPATRSELARIARQMQPLPGPAVGALAEALRTGAVVPSSHIGIREITRARPIALTVAPLAAGARQFGALVCLHDQQHPPYDEAERRLVLDLARRIAFALDHARLTREVHEVTRQRGEFLSTAAHELKTPVAGLKGTVQLMVRAQERGQLDAARLQRSLEMLSITTERLVVLTQELLDVARLQLGRLPPRLLEVDLARLLGEAARRHREQRTGRHLLALRLAVDPCPIVADPDWLEQLVTTILDNATKYSPEGGTISVALERAEDGVLLTVRDDGIGLTPGAAEGIFQPFGRSPNAVRQHLPGIGLGLPICRGIVERHGGRIWATSAGEGQGTTISAWLPSAGPALGAEG